MSSIKNISTENTELPVHIYSAGSKPGVLNTLRAIAKEFPAAHALGFRFAQRNIKARYRQSLLGILWALLPPLATAAVWIILNQNNIITVNHTGGNYALFVITGIMLWSVFTNSVLTPLQTMQANTGILVKINFPREALVVLSFYEILFNTAVAFIIILAEIIYFQVPVTLHSFLFLPALFLLIIMGLSLGTLMVPVSVLYKDIQFLLPTVLQFAMYITPVVYAQTTFKGAASIFAINPVSPAITAARDWLLGIATAINSIHLLIIAVLSLLLLIVGIIIQRIAMEILIERMGS